MYSKSQLQETEIATAKKLKIPIFYLINHEYIEIYKNCKQYICFDSFEIYQSILRDKFTLTPLFHLKLLIVLN